MTPLIGDEPKIPHGRVGTEVAPGSGVKRDRKSWTELGRAAKAGNAARATSREVRAGGDPRATDARKTSHVASMR